MQRSTKKPTALRPNRGAKRTNSRRGPVRDEAYKAWIRGWQRCMVCERVGSEHGSPAPQGTDAAHTGPHGTSQKASDRTCVPLCRKHHRELDHQLGKAFWRKYGIDRLAEIARLQKLYEEQR